MSNPTAEEFSQEVHAYRGLHDNHWCFLFPRTDGSRPAKAWIDLGEGSLDEVPESFRGRMQAAIRFYKQTFPVATDHVQQRVNVIASLYWSGMQGELTGLFNRDFRARPTFDASIRTPMTAAIADVFPEEGFAELVMSFCPRPGVRE